ncbi:hypothetical protein PHYSODRAFT_301166 [Phytophthora sojae]|uniref:Uncharacterized protein n=1 Tax=Phytophthora sojae (strain P6497) TaxID=1094619 RepID=G4ZGB7_PHYSP|nr:hypothetical protein PHYSODRAFT_301166 [Phytophthora sojae]EGZ18562.1 hypothetical protein PHYSODRAFT_301166 [Phytophthora sojae]|eukprot:XP_009527620.1 hypothetical protein PHYSODRAFT_301166 [Phytophthora sojae]
MLKKLTKKLNCNVSDALKFAAGNGRHEPVRSLLPEVIGDGEYTLDDEVLGILESMAITAAENDHYEVVQLLLARNGHVDIVELAAESVSDDDNLPASERSEALSSANSGGHAAVVEFLVECEQFQWCVLGAFDQAVSENQQEIARVIYDVYPRCNKGADLFVDLAGAGYLEAVTYLYDNGFCSSGSIGDAFVSTICSTRITVANFLVGTDSVSATAFNMAFKKAVLGGRIKSTEFLFSTGRVPPQTVNTVFPKVTKINMMKLLATKQPVSSKAIVTAFRNATCQGRFGWGTDTEAILRELCKTNCIPSEVYGEGFMTAVNTRYGGDAMGKVLYDESRISEEVIQTAFKTAADIGHSEMVRFLFDKPALRQAVKHDGFVSAAQHNQVEVVQLLARSAQWSQDALTSAFQATKNQALRRFLRTKLGIK